MDFLNALLSSFAQVFSGILLTVAVWVSSFAPPPPSPIVIAPTIKESADEANSTISIKASPDQVNQVTSAVVKPTVQTQTASVPLLDVNGLARSAVVNILCNGGTTLRSASGSGIVIDQRGVILTNAHVGQFFLLRDYPNKNSVLCTIRTGSPAKSTYYATLLFLPPAWIDANANKIGGKEATGTGENDYSFLLITGSYDDSTLPGVFPAISYTVEEPKLGGPMLLAGYPSAFLSNRDILNNLLVSSSFTVVKKLYTFDSPDTVDIFSIGSTSISYGGISGGAAVRASDGKVMGIITVATDASVVENRDLRAISTAYINRSLASQSKGGINELLSGDVSAKAADFNENVAPNLAAQLKAALNNN